MSGFLWAHLPSIRVHADWLIGANWDSDTQVCGVASHLQRALTVPNNLHTRDAKKFLAISRQELFHAILNAFRYGFLGAVVPLVPWPVPCCGSGLGVMVGAAGETPTPGLLPVPEPVSAGF